MHIESKLKRIDDHNEALVARIEGLEKMLRRCLVPENTMVPQTDKAAAPITAQGQAENEHLDDVLTPAAMMRQFAVFMDLLASSKFSRISSAFCARLQGVD